MTFSEIAPKPPATRDCWFLTGPTASGKTAVAKELARRLNAEILSLDSMAIYREMDIGTAKPSPETRQKIPHHLVDLLGPTQEFSVSQYLRLAEQTVAEIQQRGREPLFVGGSALYLKTLLRGIFHGPPADWEFRRQVEEEIEQVGLAALHQRLQQVDPLSAAKLHPHDKRRIIRALEVNKLTGRPISHLQVHFDEGRSPRESKVFALKWPRAILHQRINRRVERMFDLGLVDETRRLLERHGRLGRTASQAVGYREVIAHLEGKAALEETIRAVQARTRQFARRQETWFRHLSECRFVEMTQDKPPSATAERIIQMADEADLSGGA